MSSLLSIFPSLPTPQPKISPLSLSSSAGVEGYVLSFPLKSSVSGQVEEFGLGPVGGGGDVRGVRLTRDKIWWLMPHPDLSLPTTADTQLLLLRLAPTSFPRPFAAVLPLTTPSYTGTLRGSSSSGREAVARFERDEGEGGEGKVVVCLGTGVREVVRGVGEAMREARGWGGGVVEGLEEGVRRLMGSPTEDSEETLFSGTLTYCTWNSLQPLPKTTTSVLRTLSHLSTLSIRPSTLLIDDAWQPTNGLHDPGFDMAREEGWSGESQNGQRLTGFEMSKSFLDGVGSLKEFVGKVREEYGVGRVGVWHTTSGYWEGVEPSAFYPKYRLVKVTLNDYPGPWQPAGYAYYVPHPASASAFFADYYAYLSSQGVSFVKCDNCASLDGVESAREVTWEAQGGEVMGERVDVPTVRLALRRGVKEAAEKYFGGSTGGRVIWCMAMSPRIILGKDIGGSTGPRSIIRNSDDYFPDRPDSHRYHIFANALNGVFNAQMNLIPDLDMFQSHAYIPSSADPSALVPSEEPSPQAAYHAALRALSAGPVTLTDVAGHTDPSVLAPLLGRRTRTGPSLALQAPRTFFVGEDIFEDLLSEGKGRGMKVWSEAAWGGGVVGVWNVRSGDEGEVEDAITLEDVRPLTSASAERELYAVGSYKTSGVWVVDTSAKSFEPAGKAEVNLPPFGFEIFTVAPFFTPPTDKLAPSIACLGLVNKYNPLSALSSPPSLSAPPSARGSALSVTFKCVGVAGFVVRRVGGAGRAGEGEVRAYVGGKEVGEKGVRRVWGGEGERVEVDFEGMLRDDGEGREEEGYEVVLEVL